MSTEAAIQSSPSPGRTAAGRARAGLIALREREFRTFWCSQTLSAGGDSVVQLALPIAVVTASGSPVELGLVLTAYGCARVLALPVGGIVADRMSRKGTVLLGEATKMVAYAGMAAAMFAGR